MSRKTRLSGSMGTEGRTATLGLRLDIVTTCLGTDVVTTETSWDGTVVTTVEETLVSLICMGKHK